MTQRDDRDIRDDQTSDVPLGPDASPSAQARATASGIIGAAAGRRLGGYDIVRVLGSGGMGAVFLAEQSNPKRLVALKVIRPGMATPSIIARFEHEAQVLGRLQHPGIAQIYEAGVAGDEDHDSQPFFVMEYVRGRPLVEFADAGHLSIRERLDLFTKICDAVQHAHQKGIIHRDLKPGNILVTEDGQPKILDFGVARATDADIRTTAVKSEIGQLLGTIPYMSPEQTSGDPDGLDTRSDVYALGVVMYELLAGRLPYDVGRKLIHEAVRVIREEEPDRLSTINKIYRGDVETIVAKALEKDRVRRYQSAAELGTDIRRYLQDEPIVARPASMSYKLVKFAKRHTAVVATSVSLLVVLVAASVMITVLWRQAVTARNDAVTASSRAQQEEAAAVAARDFLLGGIREVSPQQRGPDLKLVDVLGESEVLIDETFVGHPLVQIEMHETYGWLKRALNDYDAAVRHFERALALAEAHLDPDDPRVVRLLYAAGVGMIDVGRDRDAWTHMSRARELDPSGTPAAMAEATKARAFMLHNLGDYDTSEMWFRSALAANETIDGTSLQVGICQDVLARLLIDRGKFDEAEDLLERAMLIKRREAGEHSIAVAFSLLTRGYLHYARGDWADAAADFRASRDMYVELIGDADAAQVGMPRLELAGVLTDARLAAVVLPGADDERAIDTDALGALPAAAVLLRNRGRTLHRLGFAEEGDRWLNRSVTIDRGGGTHRAESEAHTRRIWAELLHESARLDEAEALYRQTLALNEASLRDDVAFARAATLMGLGRLQLERRMTTEGCRHLDTALALRREALGPETWPVAMAELAAAEGLVAAGKIDEAEVLARHAEAVLRTSFDGTDRDRLAEAVLDAIDAHE